MTEPDYILIAKLNESSKMAFAALYDRYVGMVHSFVFSIIQDTSVAEDIIQFVFLQLWEHRKSISPDKNLPAWLYVTARNAVFKETKRLVRMSKYVQFIEGTHQVEDAVGGGRIDRRVLQRELDGIVASFPDGMRNIFIMRTTDDMTVREISESLKISVKTVETQLLRAKRIIRKKIEKI